MSILLPETQQKVDELKQQDADQLLENQRQNDIVRQQRLAVEQEAKDAKAIEREAERLEEDEKLKANLRADFMSTSPSASDEDFERLYPQLRDRHLVTNAEAEYERQNGSGATYVQRLISDVLTLRLDFSYSFFEFT